MNQIVIILVLISAVMHAVRNFFTKKANDKQIFVWWYEIVAMVVFLPLFVYYILTEGVKNPQYFYIGVAAGFVHFLYWYFLSKSYDEGDLSQVYPITRSSPALVLLFSVIFLKEKVSFVGVLGIIIVAVGVYIINMKKIGWSELIRPIKAIVSERPTQFAFLTLISIVGYTLIDKIGVGYIRPVLHIYFLTVFGFLFFTPYIFHIKNKELVKKEWTANKKSIIASGFFAISGYVLILYAFTIDKVGYIVGLRQLSIVFAVILGGHVLKEKHQGIRLSASALIFIGAFLITIAE